jgi:hypothetical protein
MNDDVRSEAMLFWGFVASDDTQNVQEAFGWHDPAWEFELARRLKLEPPEQAAFDRKRDEWDQWRMLLDEAVKDWGCTFSWYGTERNKRWFVAITKSFYVADGPTALSIDTHLQVPEEPWQLKLDAFAQLMNIPRDPATRIGWRLVARDRTFAPLPPDPDITHD